MGEVAWEEGFKSVNKEGCALGSQFGGPVLRDRRGLSLVQSQEKAALTVNSLSTASMRVSLKWLTPSIRKEPL